jgi:hypothetical protein
MTNYGLTLRVWISEEPLERYMGRQASFKDNAETRPDWVGLFRINGLKEWEGGTYLFTTGDPLRRRGIAYLPDGAPTTIRGKLEHLRGPRYRFSWS